MSTQLAPSPILAAAERLRQAEAHVETLRTIVAHFGRPCPARDIATRELAVCERSLFNRRLELADLQRARRREH
jgi:hypothetical protein